MKYISENEFAVESYEDAIKISEVLLRNDYVVMISREESLYIINYEWSPHNADRNDMIFRSREDWEIESFEED